MKLAAVITETRNYDLKRIIERHLKFLPEMDVIVFHYHNRVNYDCIKHQLPQNITNLHQYNLLMTSDFYWNRLKAYDKILVFQNDSGILREGVEEFFEYDYVGAPIKLCPYPAMNGGLSLRSVDIMRKIQACELWSPGKGFEDIFYCNLLEKYGGKLAPLNVAKKFSVETMFELGTFGYHAIDNYLTKKQCEEILNQYQINIEN